MTDEVLFRVEGSAGIISLNKPRTIHALTFDMVRAMIDQLLVWANDPAIRVILLDHADGRGFCSGGDINLLRRSTLEDGGVAGRKFFYDEYRLNHLIQGYAKPVVSFMDGITMGGGVGIAQPARYRVATENTHFAMPETGIGLFPDVGGGWHLSRLPGRVGYYLGITGARIDGADCLSIGIATHYLPAGKLAEAKARIAADPGKVVAILAELSVDAPPSRLAPYLADIGRLFAADTLEDILAALAADGSEWAIKELVGLRGKCPVSMKVVLRQFNESLKCASFADNMRMEYRIASRILVRPDFAEGVRAVIVEKDNAPRWSPASPEAVSDALIDGIFAPLPESEEWQPL